MTGDPHAGCKGECHAQQASEEVQSIQCPSHAQHAISYEIEQGEAGQPRTKQKSEPTKSLVGEPTDEEGITDVTDILKEK